MRHLTAALCCTLVLAILACGCGGGGGNGANQAPARIFLAGGDGAAFFGNFRSDDLGATWKTIEAVGPLLRISSLPGRDVGYSVDTDYRRVLKTTDGGLSWSPLPTSPPLDENGTISALSFFDADEGIASTTSFHDGDPNFRIQTYALFWTEDGGASWSRAANAAGDGIAEQLCTTPDGLAVALGTGIISRVSRPPVLLASRDGGRSWESILQLQFQGSMTCQGSATIWVAAAPHDLHRSPDAGRTWEDRTGTLPEDARNQIVDLEFTSERHGALLAGSYVDPNQRYVVTTDGGEHWASFTLPVPVFRFVSIDDRTTLALGRGEKDSLILTRDGGRSWAEVGLPPGIVYVDAVQVARSAR